MLPTTPAQTQAQAQIMSQQAALQNKNPAIQNKEHGSLDGVQPVNPPGSALAIQHPQGGDMRKAPTSFTFLALLNADVNSFTKYLSNYFESHPGNEDHQKQSGKALGKTLDAAGKTISQALANPNDEALTEAITPDLLNSFK